MTAPAGNSLKVKGVYKSLNGLKVIDNVTAVFAPGQISALIGPNGAGKTTLFNLITGELKPDAGKIIYGNKELTGKPPYSIARMGLGRLFQDIRTFDNLTVFENVASACYYQWQETPWFPFLHFNTFQKLRKDIDEKVRFWLDFVGLYREKETYGSSLSFGQQKL